MKKVIMVFTVLVIFGFAGCGGGPEKEYEAIRREFWTIIAKGEDPGKVLEVDMQEFRAASPEKQKKLIESAKKDLGVLKGDMK
ncbi:MAG: hypothetical protein IJ146_05615 [Kiritimatiellae bacterium]|nr:hypothetical protein [Kiritimatiellia bacterium]